MHLVNPGDTSVEVTLTADGAEQTVSVPPHGTAQTAVAADTTWQVTPDGPVHAGVTFAASRAIAGFPVWPADAAAADITVAP